MTDIAESSFCDMRPDMYGNGGFIAELEREIAEMLGKESAVFMPSGTMAQPIALRIWSDRASNKAVTQRAILSCMSTKGIANSTT